MTMKVAPKEDDQDLASLSPRWFTQACIAFVPGEMERFFTRARFIRWMIATGKLTDDR